MWKRLFPAQVFRPLGCIRPPDDGRGPAIAPTRRGPDDPIRLHPLFPHSLQVHCVGQSPFFMSFSTATRLGGRTGWEPRTSFERRPSATCPRTNFRQTRLWSEATRGFAGTFATGLRFRAPYIRASRLLTLVWVTCSLPPDTLSTTPSKNSLHSGHHDHSTPRHSVQPAQRLESMQQNIV